MDKELNDRVLCCVRAWNVAIERTVATDTALLVHGRRGGAPVTLKVVKAPGDEWRCGDTRIAASLLEPARRIYADLAATQREPALLHGDLHHYNVLSDRARGWCAIDPKGVVGELEFELRVALRNPIGRPDLFASLEIAERRLEHFGLALGIDSSALAADFID